MIRVIGFVLLATLMFVPQLSRAEEITLEDKACGSRHSLSVGDLLEVRLPGNPTTGYVWTATAIPEQLRRQGAPVHISDSQRVGAGGITSFRFIVVAAGDVRLDLAYRRPWESQIQPARTCSIQLQLALSAANEDNIPQTLSSARTQVAAEFDRLDIALGKAAGQLGKTGLTGDEARRVLAKTCEELSYAIDCSTVDTRGRLTTIEPARYRSFEGKDISDQEQVKRILQLHKPVLSDGFRSVEGVDAVDAEYPVFTPDGRFIGSLSVMFKPEYFLGHIIAPLVKETALDIRVLEQGGRILYDADPKRIGLNVVTSPMDRSDEEQILLAQRILKTPRAEGVFRSKKKAAAGGDVVKKAHWQSVGLYGTDWRLVGIHQE
jgi:predicted secreted protein